VLQHRITTAKKIISQSMARVRGSRTLVEAKPESFTPTTERYPSWILFAREIWRNPRAMGAACPSSQRLAQTMAHLVPLHQEGLTLELGAGTGIITRALLHRGIAPKRLISIELSPTLANYLHRNFPHVRVIHGDARELDKLLGEDYHRVSTVVSGLPFRSIPQVIKRDIIQQIDQMLPREGLLIQFTYDLSGRTFRLPSHFKRIATKWVWNNLPPARIDVYQSNRLN
jgi:phospholipid N-methyltransferase